MANQRQPRVTSKQPAPPRPPNTATSSVNYREAPPQYAVPAFRERQTGPPPAGLVVSGNPYRDGEALQDTSELDTERGTGLAWGADYLDPAILEAAASYGATVIQAADRSVTIDPDD